MPWRERWSRTRTRSDLCSWLPINGTTPFCHCIPFSCSEPMEKQNILLTSGISAVSQRDKKRSLFLGADQWNVAFLSPFTLHMQGMSGNERMHNNRSQAHYPRMNLSSQVGSFLLLLCITIRTVGLYGTKIFPPQGGQFEIQGGMVLLRRTKQDAKEIDRQ